MPEAITHYLHGQRVLECLERRREPVAIEKDAFLLGCQGPDFFYYHRRLPWQKGKNLREYGTMLHKGEPEALLQVMRQILEQSSQNAAIFSYIGGFLCHYSLDRIAHPFVNFGAEELLKQHPDQTKNIFHAQIESSLDIIILRYEKALLPMEFPLKRVVPKGRGLWERIADFYAAVLDGRFGQRVPVASICQAMGDMRTALGWLNDRTTLKRNLVQRYEVSHGGLWELSSRFRGAMEDGETDYANSLENQWDDGHGPRTESFFTLFENAVEDACYLYDGFSGGDDLKQLTKGIPFV